uniref:Uncharacterized protein n=1 Tax=Pyxicephalus adspersus TaxID=30357 RepID=A0AAV3B5M1_PYXAD|nr:TPA: hypothetical protein GDO54_000625 [Pyxicephalus adspersus]
MIEGLWGLVNNAGTGMPGAPNEWLTKKDFEKVINVNLLGPVDITIKLLPLIRKSKGRIVNMRELSPFGVKVSIIEPGYFKTGLNDMQNMKNCLKNVWKNVHPEVQYSFGEKYFEQYVSDMEKTFSSMCNTDLTPVTDCIEHALTAVHPKTRYTAGWDAKIFFIPLSYVPTVISDYLLTRTAPTPAH